MREAGVETDAWDLQPEAVRAEDAQAIGPCGIQHPLAQSIVAVEARRDDHRRAGTCFAEFVD